MHCQNCGAALSADATQCPDCGADAPDRAAQNATGRDERASETANRQRGQGGHRQGQQQQGQPRGQHERPQQSQQPRQQAQQPPQQSQQQQRSRQRSQQQQQRTRRARQPAADERQGGHADGRAPPGRESSGSPVGQLVGAWGITRFGAIGGGILAGFSVTQPWVEAEVGGVSADAMATLFGPVVALAAAVAVLASISNWGRGWGWLSMILSGIAGLAVAGTGAFARTYLSETTTLNTIEVEGRDVPVAAVEPGGGVELAILAGVVVTVAALAGIVGALANR